MIPDELDHSLLWDDFDLNNGAHSEDQGPNQVARDEEGEPIWHTMPAALEALSHAPHSHAASKSKNDPDTLTWDQAMAHPWKEQFLESAAKEIKELEDHGTWVEIPRSQATDQIIPTTWVFRIKRKPDGTFKKVKGRLAIRGDLEKNKNKINEAGIEETCASPVVFWSAVRTFMVLAIVLGWETISIDCLNAFVQASIDRPTFIQVPRGFKTAKGDRDTCLSLRKGLCGLCRSPRSFFDCSKGILIKIGFIQSKTDPCLFFRKGLIVVTHVDDFGIAFSSKEVLEEFLKELEANSLSCTREESFHEFLGIQIDKPDDGTLLLTQKGLIKKVLEAAKMENCNTAHTPAQAAALGAHEDAEPHNDKEFNPRSIVGMLMCLATNTRIDIALAVSQVCRFTSCFKKPHGDAVKQILKCLKGTVDKGTIAKPEGHLNLKCWTDADFAGLHKREDSKNPSSARSRTGHIITLSGVPLHWKSTLQKEVCTSSCESECVSLGHALKALLPLIELVKECCIQVGLPTDSVASIHADVFEDNSACLILATKQMMTSRTRWFHQRWHWFWQIIKTNPNIKLHKVETSQQAADGLTKPLNREVFERIRKLVQKW